MRFTGLVAWLMLGACSGAEPKAAPQPAAIDLPTPPSSPTEGDAGFQGKMAIPTGAPAKAGEVGAVDVAAAATAPRPLAPPNPNAAPAEKLFTEARELMQTGQIAAACIKFEASLKLDFAVGTLMNLARCHEQSGQTPLACREYRQAAEASRNAGQHDRERFANETANKLSCPP